MEFLCSLEVVGAGACMSEIFDGLNPETSGFIGCGKGDFIAELDRVIHTQCKIARVRPHRTDTGAAQAAFVIADIPRIFVDRDIAAINESQEMHLTGYTIG